MTAIIRSLAAAALALASVIAVSTTWAMSTAIPLLAANTTALIMGGTFHPLVGPKDTPDFVSDYLDHAVDGHLDLAFANQVTNAVAVFTPEDFFPLGPLTLDKSVALGRANLNKCLAAADDCVINTDPAAAADVGSVAPAPGDALDVFGYSQSSIIASLAKRDLIDGYQPGDQPVSFMLIANPMRPNGGVLMRGQGWPTIPILGISFTGASPTDSVQLDDGTYAYPTVDVARQYDGLGGDFPVRPLNLIALLNALLGYGLLHGETVNVPFDQALYQGREGDTSYYLIPTDIVPLLQPLAFIIPKPILMALDAPLRVIIEDAYDRDISPGTPTKFSWWPVHNVFHLAAGLIKSIPVAVDNLFQGYGLPRVLGTKAPGVYGIGGPDLPADPNAVPATNAQREQLAPTSHDAIAEDVEPQSDPEVTSDAGGSADGAAAVDVAPVDPGTDEPAPPGDDADEVQQVAEAPEPEEPATSEPQPGDATPPADPGTDSNPSEAGSAGAAHHGHQKHRKHQDAAA